METTDTYVLIKRDLFWSPNSQGYTGALSKAGDYSTNDISGRPLLDAYDPKHEWEETYALLKSAAPEFTKACCVYVQRDTLKSERDAALSVQKQLVEALEEIVAYHIPDQPMTDGGDELSWAYRQHGKLRQIARAAILAAKASL